MTGDQAKELQQVKLWEYLIEEIDGLIKFETSKLRMCKVEDLKAIQDKITVYETIKILPQIIIDREEE